MAKQAKTQNKSALFPNWEVKERVYVLTREATPISYQLRSRHTQHKELSYFDEDAQYSRALRYATNQTSFFEDEQNDEMVVLGSIVFEDGKLIVPAQNVTLQQFLAIHPDNNENGGVGFLEFDPDKAARQQLDKELKGFEAVSIAMDMAIEDLEAVGRVLFHSAVDTLTSGELKRDVVMYAKNNPAAFTEIANNSNVRMMNLAQKAINLGLIKIKDDNSTVAWAANGKEIVKLPFSNEPLSTLAVWLKTDEGLVLVESLAAKMK